MVRGENRSQLFLTFFGEIRAVIASMHSKRLPGSNDPHCEHACMSVPHRGQRLSAAMADETGLPHWEQRITSRNPGMLMFFGPSCERRLAPAGAPGSMGFLTAGFGARSRLSS